MISENWLLLLLGIIHNFRKIYPMLQRKNLLLVEDDAIVLSALCELLLASDEYYITKAESCDDVHLFFKDNHFDLVILNPKMLKGCVQNFLDFFSGWVFWANYLFLFGQGNSRA